MNGQTQSNFQDGDIVYAFIYGKVCKGVVDGIAYCDEGTVSFETRNHHGYTVYPTMKARRVFRNRQDVVAA